MDSSPDGICVVKNCSTDRPFYKIHNLRCREQGVEHRKICEPTLAYVRILEELVDHMADLLEATSRDLDDASHLIFRHDRSRRLSRETALLRQLLFRTGRSSERMARINYAPWYGVVNRIQLLQDAATGIINVAQNEVMKILTIASVAGIPPVLVAGIYGMNFKNMPELNWVWGYPYALALIVVTTLIPLIWFKWKDWMIFCDA